MPEDAILYARVRVYLRRAPVQSGGLGSRGNFPTFFLLLYEVDVEPEYLLDSFISFCESVIPRVSL